MTKKSREDWKIYKNVFDNFTERTIFKLQGQKVIDELLSPVKIGKESNVFTASSKAGDVVVKIYRLHSCNFNKMNEYIIDDPRYGELKGKRRDIIFSWVQREYRNLMKAREAGVRVPTPLTFVNNIIVMELIGKPAPQLKDGIPNNPENFLDLIIEEYKKLYKAKLIHGDLSEFNILNFNEKPVFIDFSQGTMIESSKAKELMDRDARNLARFFNKIGHECSEEEIYSAIFK